MTYIPLTKTPFDILQSLYTLFTAGLIISLVITVIIYYAFVKRSKEPYHGIRKRISDFLNFRNYNIESTLKLLYICGMVLITMCAVLSFFVTANYLLATAAAVIIMVIGQLIWRFGFQCIMAVIDTRNTNRSILDRLNKIQPRLDSLYNLSRENRKETKTVKAEKPASVTAKESKQVSVQKKEETAETPKTKQTSPRKRKPRKTGNKTKAATEKSADK